MGGVFSGFSEETLSQPPYNQAHLFDGATPEQKASIVAQLNELDGKLPGDGLKGYLERARGLLEAAKSGANPFAGMTPEVPSGEWLTAEAAPGTEKYAELEKLGMAELGKCAFCLVAGGLGERLGYPGIKIGITAEVTTGVTFIELYVKYILAFQAYARETTGDSYLEVPLAIMTSGDTHEPTLELLKANDNFGLSSYQLTIMKQEKVPALMDVEAKIAVKNGEVETKPHGHGDVHALLYQQGLPRQWLRQGKQWLVLFQDTNPLPFRSLCALLGVSVKNEFVMNSVAVPRLPGEAVGGIARLVKDDGEALTINVEYNQLDPLLKGTKDGKGDVADKATGFSPYPGNINILILRLPEMSERLQATAGIVPEFVNPKWADETKSKFKSPTRLECMMQDFPRLCTKEDKVGFTGLKRLMCFTCVKNNLADAAKKSPPDCALSAEADIYASNIELFKLAGGSDVTIESPSRVNYLGIKAEIGARIIMMPSFGISLEAMKTKLKGKIKISRKSVLILDGDITIDGLQLDGALKVSGKGTLKDKVVKNAGMPLVEISKADLASADASLQIRGYQQSQGTIEEVVLTPE